MTETIRVNRRLTAVVFADVAGFSAAVEADDARTVRRWAALRRDLLEPLIAGHGGSLRRVVGDALLVDFASVVDAASWALEVQRRLAEAGGELALRIGMNVEDAIVDDGDLHGDGVNIASRIQALAQPGETVVTATVRDYLLHKLDVDFADLGEQRLKNISRPVRVFRLGAGVPLRPAARPANTARPGVAVLPFRNLGGDAREDYFGEGITEDIIAGLARNHALLVIARHSTLPYRDRHADARQIARELGVRYLVGGSVRRHASTLRISAELNDAEDNRTLWAERYQGSDDDLFEFQDRIAGSVVATIDPRIHEAETRRARQKPTDNLDAYDCILKAFSLLYSPDNGDFFQAGSFLDRAIQLDPFYAQAHAHKAWWYVLLIGDAKCQNRRLDSRLALDCATRAIGLDSEDAFVLATAAHVRSFVGGQPEEGRELYERALGLNPNLALAWGGSAITLCYLGEGELAETRLERARRLSPFDPLAFFWDCGSGLAALVGGRYAEGETWFARSRREKPTFVAAMRLQAACLALAGHDEQARAVGREFLAADPAFRVDEFLSWYPLQRDDDRERLALGLRRAGLPG